MKHTVYNFIVLSFFLIFNISDLLNNSFCIIYRISKEPASTPTSTITTTPTSKGSTRKSGVPVPSESDCSDHEGTPIPTTSHLHPSDTRTSPTIDRLETSDRMSKEKRKFFRLSAFNADKNRDKKAIKSVTGSSDNKKDDSVETKPTDKKLEKKAASKKDYTVQRITQNRVCKNVRSKDEVTKPSHNNSSISNTKDTNNKSVKAKLNKDSSNVSEKLSKSKTAKTKCEKTKDLIESDSNCSVEVATKVKRSSKTKVAESSSASSSSSEDVSSSSDSESDSSMELSETSNSNAKRSNTAFVSNEETKTFGTVGGITINNKDDVWGFAAAAAAGEAKQKEVVRPDDTTKSESPTDKDAVDNKNSNKNNNSHIDDKNSDSVIINTDRGRTGLGQLKGLFDGLSHLFATPTLNRSRSGNSPNYNPSRRKKPENAEQTNEEIDKNKNSEQVTPSKDKIEKVVEEEVKEKVIKQEMVKEKVAKQEVVKEKVTKQEVVKDKVAKQEVVVKEKVRKEKLEKDKTETKNQISELKLASVNGQKRTASPQPLRKFSHSIKVLASEDKPTQMTPSNLVKTAVNSKRHELERRKFLKSEAGLGTVGFSQKAMLEDARMKKRNLIAEATQTNHPLSVLPLSNNQTGKIRLQPNYTCFLSFPLNLFFPLCLKYMVCVHRQ